MPNTLQVKLNGNNFELAIIRKAECSLIHSRMKSINFNVNHLQTEKANTKTALQQKLDDPTFTKLLNTIFSNKEKTYLLYKNNQIKRLDLLISKASNTNSMTAHR